MTTGRRWLGVRHESGASLPPPPSFPGSSALPAAFVVSSSSGAAGLAAVLARSLPWDGRRLPCPRPGLTGKRCGGAPWGDSSRSAALPLPPGEARSPPGTRDPSAPERGRAQGSRVPFGAAAALAPVVPAPHPAGFLKGNLRGESSKPVGGPPVGVRVNENVFI